MKRITTIFIAILLVSINFTNAQSREYTADTLSMSPMYSNDIFYSMKDGEVANIPRAGWELAFYTDAFSAGIIINEGSGVELFSYPSGDTTDWDNIDTTGLSTWKPLYNSPEYWEDGAFNRGALGHPDYGWGIYNMVTHTVTGDSLYIINTPGVGFKKLWIVKKVSVENVYHIKYANLDGSDETLATIDAKPYTAKNFIYFSMENNEVIDREPTQSWDLLFTKYIDFTEDNSGNQVEYLVTGVTSNINHFASKFTEVGADFDDWASKPFDSLKNVVGYNWKSFDMSTFSWVVDDSTAFFVKSNEGDVYKMIFTYWAGMGSGDFALNKEVVSASSVGDIVVVESNLVIFPNPATNVLNVQVNENQFEGTLIITDISGRTIYKSDVTDNTTVDINNFNSGIYFVTVYNDLMRDSQKLLVK